MFASAQKGVTGALSRWSGAGGEFAAANQQDVWSRVERGRGWRVPSRLASGPPAILDAAAQLNPSPAFVTCGAGRPAAQYGHDEHVTASSSSTGGIQFRHRIRPGAGTGHNRGVQPRRCRAVSAQAPNPCALLTSDEIESFAANASVGDGVASSLPSFEYATCRYAWGAGTGRFTLDVIVYDATRRFPG